MLLLQNGAACCLYIPVQRAGAPHPVHCSSVRSPKRHACEEERAGVLLLQLTSSRFSSLLQERPLLLMLVCAKRMSSHSI